MDNQHCKVGETYNQNDPPVLILSTSSDPSIPALIAKSTINVMTMGKNVNGGSKSTNLYHKISSILRFIVLLRTNDSWIIDDVKKMTLTIRIQPRCKEELTCKVPDKTSVNSSRMRCICCTSIHYLLLHATNQTYCLSLSQDPKPPRDHTLPETPVLGSALKVIISQ